MSVTTTNTTYTVKHKPRDGNKFTFTTDENTTTYTIVKRLGKSLAIVDLCRRDDNTDEHMAIKTMKLDKNGVNNPSTACGLIMDAVELIQSRELEYVVHVHGSYHWKNGDKHYLYTIMKYYEHGDLEDYLKKNTRLVSEPTIISILKQLSYALNSLHLEAIIHCDIKVTQFI
jgi:serine/threonine protein kinase